jgi:cytochrome c556
VPFKFVLPKVAHFPLVRSAKFDALGRVDRDPATDTFASPDLWANFADFYQRATDASKLAFAASRAERADQFRASIAQLRAACNGCHAAYQKKE